MIVATETVVRCSKARVERDRLPVRRLRFVQFVQFRQHAGEIVGCFRAGPELRRPAQLVARLGRTPGEQQDHRQIVVRVGVTRILRQDLPVKRLRLAQPPRRMVGHRQSKRLIDPRHRPNHAFVSGLSQKMSSGIVAGRHAQLVMPRQISTRS